MDHGVFDPPSPVQSQSQSMALLPIQMTQPVMVIFSLYSLSIICSISHFSFISIWCQSNPEYIHHRISTSSVTDWLNDLVTYQERWHRISNGNQWTIIDDWNKQALWPLTFIITNYPQLNTADFKFYHDITITNQLAVQYSFNSAFIPNQDIDIYIMGDSTNEQFTISNITISLSYTSTMEPTSNPSYPTQNPTTSPSKTPTNNPSTIPSISPSIMPSVSPMTSFP